MRSRYSAFALGERDYLLESWHSNHRPASLELDASIHWISLDVFQHEEDGDRATVEFEASLLCQGRVSAMRERSRFLRLQGRWYYTDGDALPAGFEAWQPGRNESCPCGSGKKFKRCCATR